MGIRLFSKDFRQPIYDIYGFVRFADEIVDTFFNQPQELLLDEFRKETETSFKRGFSINPVLHRFQKVVREFGIPHDLVWSFLESMAMDMKMREHSRSSYEKYVYGSAEVVGLMCLRVFVGGNNEEYERLKPQAKRLGAAFQKVNFLRDLKSDFEERGRMYFPNVNYQSFNTKEKLEIEREIQADFDEALKGVRQLPTGAKRGVLLAFTYYQGLLRKIRSSSPAIVKSQRIRVQDSRKFLLLLKVWLFQRRALNG